MHRLSYPDFQGAVQGRLVIGDAHNTSIILGEMLAITGCAGVLSWVPALLLCRLLAKEEGPALGPSSRFVLLSLLGGEDYHPLEAAEDCSIVFEHSVAC